MYFLSGEEKFGFPSGGKRKIFTWASKINLVVTGQELPAEQQAAMTLPGVELVAGAMKNTLGAFKAKLGAKTDAPVKVAAKCSACGAPTSGTRGLAVTCEYCGTTQQL